MFLIMVILIVVAFAFGGPIVGLLALIAAILIAREV